MDSEGNLINAIWGADRGELRQVDVEFAEADAEGYKRLSISAGTGQVTLSSANCDALYRADEQLVSYEYFAQDGHEVVFSAAGIQRSIDAGIADMFREEYYPPLEIIAE